MHDLLRNYINGEWAPSVTGRTAPNINPATGESIGDLTLSSADDIERAVDAASAAFPKWRDVPAPTRAKVVFEAWRILGERAEEVARALTLEEGKTLAESMGEVQKTRSLLEFLAGEGRRMTGQSIPSELPNTVCWTRRDPLGVVGLITPWNFPVAIPFWKTAPALITGNTVVLKPAQLTPWTASLMAEIFHDAGLPPGVLNVVHGPGSACGSALVEHPKVQAISFTGSNEVGNQIYVSAAQRLKPLQAEMGGKNPIIVLADADLDMAIASAAAGAFGSTGQRCTATSRALVHRDVVEPFLEGVKAAAEAYIPGNGVDEGVTMGPIVDERQLTSVLGYIETGKSEARLVTGGHRIDTAPLDKGNFVAPTVFADAPRDSVIANEEIFGPVLTVIAVNDLEDALEVANSVEYGLSSSLYTRDLNAAFRYLDGVHSGITHVNSPTVGGEAQVPFGGVKATGVGPREMGRTAIEFFTEVKSVYVDYTGSLRKGHTY